MTGRNAASVITGSRIPSKEDSSGQFSVGKEATAVPPFVQQSKSLQAWRRCHLCYCSWGYLCPSRAYACLVLLQHLAFVCTEPSTSSYLYKCQLQTMQNVSSVSRLIVLYQGRNPKCDTGEYSQFSGTYLSSHTFFHSLLLCMFPCCQLIIKHERCPLKQKLT